MKVFHSIRMSLPIQKPIIISRARAEYSYRGTEYSYKFERSVRRHLPEPRRPIPMVRMGAPVRNVPLFSILERRNAPHKLLTPH